MTTSPDRGTKVFACTMDGCEFKLMWDAVVWSNHAKAWVANKIPLNEAKESANRALIYHVKTKHC